MPGPGQKDEVHLETGQREYVVRERYMLQVREPLEAQPQAGLVLSQSVAVGLLGRLEQQSLLADSIVSGEL